MFSAIRCASPAHKNAWGASSNCSLLTYDCNLNARITLGGGGEITSYCKESDLFFNLSTAFKIVNKNLIFISHVKCLFHALKIEIYLRY